MRTKYSVEQDFEVDSKFYNLQARGNSFDELFDDASVAEIGDDGEELNCSPVYNVDPKVADRVIKALKRETA